VELGHRARDPACGEGGVDVAEPRLRQIGAIVSETDNAGKLRGLRRRGRCPLLVLFFAHGVAGLVDACVCEKNHVVSYHCGSTNYGM
jgi:hypothetical protein